VNPSRRLRVLRILNVKNEKREGFRKVVWACSIVSSPLVSRVDTDQCEKHGDYLQHPFSRSRGFVVHRLHPQKFGFFRPTITFMSHWETLTVPVSVMMSPLNPGKGMFPL